MYIVIGGGGVMGQGLARSLVANRHDVVVVEQDRSVCESVASRLGALAIQGSANDFDILEDAGIEKADAAVAAMPADADNLAFCLLARNFNVPRVMARMRDPRYETAYKMAGVALTVNVAELFVGRLVPEIEQPALRQIATFGGGKASIVVARVPEHGLADGKTVEEVLELKGYPQQCVIAGIYREADGQFIFPRGPLTFHTGDQVFLAASADTVSQAAAVFQKAR